MLSPKSSPWQRGRGAGLAFTLALLLALLIGAAQGQQAKVDVLRIGTSGTLTGSDAGGKEKAGLDTLHAYIKDETGLENEIVRQKSWQELTDKLAKGQLELGVFPGYEFAWAQEKQSDLKPLALAVNVYTYPVVYVVAQRNDAATDFAGLKGHSLAVPANGQSFLRLFVDRQSEAAGKKAEEFFSKITEPDNVEDALDDLVDGKVQAVVVDRAGLEAYKRRKPGRFKQLKEVAKSQPFPPAVVAYYGSKLDDATLKRFKEGLLGASKKERGQTLLTMFHLTTFESPSEDFAKVLAETRKAYPPADAKK
jgi:ABC-type phosphate/phosphonate transport system substrate-binding protein